VGFVRCSRKKTFVRTADRVCSTLHRRRSIRERKLNVCGAGQTKRCRGETEPCEPAYVISYSLSRKHGCRSHASRKQWIGAKPTPLRRPYHTGRSRSSRRSLTRTRFRWRPNGRLAGYPSEIEGDSAIYPSQRRDALGDSDPPCGKERLQCSSVNSRLLPCLAKCLTSWPPVHYFAYRMVPR
jgi:hypothetical protein